MSGSRTATMPSREGRVAGLILAAGRSRRLGRPKQTLAFGDGTLLEHVILQAEAAADLDPIVVVLPAGDLVPDPRMRRTRIVHVEHGEACSSSLHAGLRALPEGVDAVAVLPSDQPALDAALIGQAVQAWLRSRAPALTLAYRGVPGHPLIFSTALSGELDALHGEKAMWRLLESLGEAVERVPVDVPLPQDIDTVEDYERVLSGIAQLDGDHGAE